MVIQHLILLVSEFRSSNFFNQKNLINYFYFIRNGGSYFSKLHRDWFDEGRQTLFAIEDPNDPENDVGRSSFRMDSIRFEFKNH